MIWPWASFPHLHHFSFPLPSLLSVLNIPFLPFLTYANSHWPCGPLTMLRSLFLGSLNHVALNLFFLWKVRAIWLCRILVVGTDIYLFSCGMQTFSCGMLGSSSLPTDWTPAPMQWERRALLIDHQGSTLFLFFFFHIISWMSSPLFPGLPTYPSWPCLAITLSLKPESQWTDSIPPDICITASCKDIFICLFNLPLSILHNKLCVIRWRCLLFILASNTVLGDLILMLFESLKKILKENSGRLETAATAD